MPWLLRAGWVAVVVVGGAAIDDATIGRSGAIATSLSWAAFVGWLVGVLAMAVPGVIPLTAVRVIVPLAVPVAVAAIAGGATGASGWSFLVVSLVASLLACSADVGRSFVQASAYGEEDRHLLRAPAAYLAAAVLAWAIWTCLLMAATLLLADGRWIAGAVAAVGAVGVGAAASPRWHRLARRWFVVVPIGIVVHDHLVLAETWMLRRQEIAALRLAPAATEAADLTGPAGGHAIEVSTTEPTTVIYAATPKTPGGRAIHLTAALVAPTRPGRALAAAAARRLPVG